MMDTFPAIEYETKKISKLGRALRAFILHINYPNEIFDGRAVIKVKIVFHDVAYMEPKPIVKIGWLIG